MIAVQMALLDDLDAELRRALLARDRRTADVVRMLKTRIVQRRTALARVDVDDALVHRVIVEYRNEMTRTLRDYAKLGERGIEQADDLVVDVGVCERFVPPLLDREAIVALARAAIADGAIDVDGVVLRVMAAHRDEVLGDDIIAVAGELLQVPR